MSFKIEVKGLDKIQRMLDDLKDSVDPETFNKWADLVGMTAKQICSDPDCKRIKINREGEGKVNFQFADREAIDCMTQSILRHLPQMPPIVQEEFKIMKTEFERIRAQNSV